MPNEADEEPLNPQELRRRAIERLKGRHGTVAEMPTGDVEKLVHELEVYQVELEVQNEDLRRAQMEVEEALRRYRDLYDGAPVGYLTLDDRDTIIQANQAASRLCSRERDELEGEDLERILVPEDGGKLWLLLRRTASTGRLLSGDFRLYRPGRPARWVHADVSLLHPSVGASSGFRVTLTDITGRAEAEEALRQSEARLVQAVRVARLGTFDYDHRSETIEHSPMMRAMTGYKLHEKITLANLFERVVPEDRPALERAIQAARDPAGNGVLELEYRVRRAGGGVRWLSVRSETFFEGAGTARHPVRTIGVAQEVTERKEMLRALTHAKEQLRQHAEDLEKIVQERTEKLQRTVQELEHFSYTITHDMRAPLRAMRGFGDILLMGFADSLDPSAKEYIHRIHQSADRMDRLITDALDYGKILRGEMELSPVNAKALLEGMVESYPEFQPPRAEISIEDHMPLVLSNEAGLTQAFSNLLGNAVKFVPPDRTPKVRVRAEPRGAYVRLWFEDNGTGIPTEYQQVIWGMFQKLDRGNEGTGVGLALVRKVVERMQGNVGVESEPGQGSRFWVELKPA